MQRISFLERVRRQLSKSTYAIRYIYFKVRYDYIDNVGASHPLSRFSHGKPDGRLGGCRIAKDWPECSKWGECVSVFATIYVPVPLLHDVVWRWGSGGGGGAQLNPLSVDRTTTTGVYYHPRLLRSHASALMISATALIGDSQMPFQHALCRQNKN